MFKSKLIRVGVIAIAVSALLAVSGCKQAEDSVSESNYSVSGSANRVTATVSGVILDGYGNAIDGVEIYYSNGVRSARALASTSTNAQGRFELQFLNESTDKGSGTGNGYTVTLKKAGYTTYRKEVIVPNIEDIRAAGHIFGTETIELKGANGDHAVVSSNYDGFHASLGLEEIYLYKLDATVTGTFRVKKSIAVTNEEALIPGTGSLVTFALGEDYEPHVFTARTDADGKFVFSTETLNPLPVFNAANISKLGSFPWAGTDNFFIQPTGEVFTKWSDTDGIFSYKTTSAKLATIAAEGSTDIGLVYAVGEVKAIVTNVTPKTTDGNRMAPDADIVLTFDQPMNKASVTATDITFKTGATTYSTAGTTIAWNDAGDILTINPGLNFPKGAEVTMSLTDSFRSAKDYKLTALVAGNKFFIQKGIELLYTSWKDINDNESKVAVADSVTLTFNVPIVEIDQLASILKEGGTTEIPATFTSAGAVLTVNPSYELKAGSNYTVESRVRSGLNDKDWVTIVAVDYTFDTVENVKAKLIGSNALTTKFAPVANFAIADSITLTFDGPVAATSADKKTLLKDDLFLYLGDATSTTVVDALVTSAGAVVTCDPRVSLVLGEEYTIKGNVWNGLENASNTAVSLTFNTVEAETLPALTLNKDDVAKKIDSNRPEYAGTEVEFFVNVKRYEVATYEFEYKLATGTAWVNTFSNIARTEDSVSYYYTLEIPASVFVSGETLQIRSRVKGDGCINFSDWSNVVEFKDGIAPVRTDIALAGGVPPTNGEFALSIAANPDPINSVNTPVTILLGGGEKLIASVSRNTLVAPTTVRLERNNDSQWTLNILVAPNTTTAPTGLLEITLTDGERNQIDMNTDTAGYQFLTININ